eukprot:Ihof_evm5s519 gene=Ihof_evmTU5s519
MASDSRYTNYGSTTTAQESAIIITPNSTATASDSTIQYDHGFHDVTPEGVDYFAHHHIGHTHMSHRAPWLRACVLGANDGLVSIACLMLGMAASNQSSHGTVVRSGFAGLVAGALSMALGEYVSVATQLDSEQADIEKERIEQTKGVEAQKHEFYELMQIYVDKGLSKDLAFKVALELTTKQDVVLVHAKEELGIDPEAMADPITASVVSAISFSLGGGVPLVTGAFVTDRIILLIVITIVSVFGLFALGCTGSKLGGSSLLW